MKNNLGIQFTAIDHDVLRLGLSELTFIERQILTYRFWHDFTIEEISTTCDMSWTDVSQNIDSSLIKLKKFCLDHELFSLYDESNSESDLCR